MGDWKSGGDIALVVCMTQNGVGSIMGLMSEIHNQNRLKLVAFLRHCLDKIYGMIMWNN